jgi:hypothetical protein
MRLIERGQLRLETRQTLTCRIHIANRRQTHFTVRLDFLLHVQLRSSRKCNIDLIARCECRTGLRTVCFSRHRWRWIHVRTPTCHHTQGQDKSTDEPGLQTNPHLPARTGGLHHTFIDIIFHVFF